MTRTFFWSSADTGLRSNAHKRTGTRIATLVPVPALAPELTADGLVLWRVRRSERQVWCEVKDLSGELLIRVLDPATARSVVSEVHDTVAAVVGRAVQLQHQFSAAGWELVDFDLDELE